MCFAIRPFLVPFLACDFESYEHICSPRLSGWFSLLAICVMFDSARKYNSVLHPYIHTYLTYLHSTDLKSIPCRRCGWPQKYLGIQLSGCLLKAKCTKGTAYNCPGSPCHPFHPYPILSCFNIAMYPYFLPPPPSSLPLSSVFSSPSRSKRQLS